jgi:triacylglycerol lipase
MALTSPPGYDNDLALRLAAACQLAYDLVADPNSAAPAGYQIGATFQVNLLNELEMLGYVMSSAADVIVAFRGTDSFPDFVADVGYPEVAYPYVAGAGLTHRGFTAVYVSCRDQILAALQVLPPGRPLFITGHSLGGAVATLAALDIAVNSAYKTPVIYTYGSPRVGDPTFADAYDSTVATSVRSSWRVLNAFDVVPLLPPEKIYDALQLQYFYYRHVDTWLPLGFVKGGIVANHALANYITALEDL